MDHKRVKIDCSSSVNPLGTPQKAIQAIVRGVRTLSQRYPDPECSELKKSLSRYLKVDPDWIIVGNGAMEIIYWFAQAFAGKQVVVPAPTFCEYELASQRAGAAVRFIPLHHFELDSDSIIRNAKGSDAIFLCNPNNPTGMLSTVGIAKIINSVGIHTMILLDECFIELVNDPERNSFVRKINEFKNLVILRSLTKSFGLAGLRLGYAICNPSAAERMKKYRIPWNVNGLAQAAGVAALSDANHLERARAIIARERRFLRSGIGKMKAFAPHDSDANFFMVNLRHRDSTQFRDSLLKKTGVLIRDCSTFTGMDSHHVRIAVKTRKENMILLQALEAFDRG